MKKIFQNKSLLKSVQIFLVCLVVLGGVGNVEAVVGDTWIEVTPNANWAPKYVAGELIDFNGEMWIVGDALGGNRANSWRSSSDGTSWTEVVSLTGWGNKYNHSTLVFDYDSDGTDEIVAIGGQTDLTTPSQKVFASKDGKNWNELVDFGPSTTRPSSVVFNGKMWVTGGIPNPQDWGGFPSNNVYNSSDGSNWTFTTADWLPRHGHSLTVFDNKLWVMGGVDHLDNYFNDIWYSSDGITWTELIPTGPIWSERAAHSSVVFDNKLWVMGGFFHTWHNPNYFNDIWYLDLADIDYGFNTGNWQQVTVINPLWQKRVSHGSIVFNSEIWVMGGQGVTGLLNDVWRTDTTWPLPTCTFTATPNSIISGNSSTLTWTTENTDSADISSVPVDATIIPINAATDLPDGSMSVSPLLNTAYTLTVANASGDTVTCSAMVDVCVPRECSYYPGQCGTALDDGCGGTMDCGGVCLGTDASCECIGGHCTVCVSPIACVAGHCDRSHDLWIMDKLVKDIVKDAIGWVVNILAILAILMAVIGGIALIGSSGDPRKAAFAKKIIFWALGGLMIAGISYAIIKLIEEIAMK